MNCKPQGSFPSRHPIDVTPKVWMYENTGSITLVGTGHDRIPLRQLAQIVDRYRKYRAKRNRK